MEIQSDQKIYLATLLGNGFLGWKTMPTTNLAASAVGAKEERYLPRLVGYSFFTLLLSEILSKYV